MHKIRLYVVPEVLEEESPKLEDVVIDEIDLPIELPPMMQRRNSRRPNSGIGSGIGGGSSVRLNVIQKDRKTDSILPKLKQIGQLQLQQSIKNVNNEIKNNKESSIIISPLNFNNKIKKNNNNNDDNNLQIKTRIKMEKKNYHNHRQDIGKDDEIIKSVFASPRIKEFAHNLEVKIIERNEKLLKNNKKLENDNDNKLIKLKKDDENFHNHLINHQELIKSDYNFNRSVADTVNPRKIIKNEITDKFNKSKSLTPIFESSSSSSSTSSMSNSYSFSKSIKNDSNDHSYSMINNDPYYRSSTIINKDNLHDDDKKYNIKTGVDTSSMINHHDDIIINTDDEKNFGKNNHINNNNIIINNNNNGIKNNHDFHGGISVDNGIQIIVSNTGNNNNNNNNNSVILRRNNKLNRYREYDLEQKIEVEIKMREGSARLLAAARHRAQSLEAARALLTSNERMSAYMAELQRRKKEPSSNKPSLPISNARVSLSDLRVPLMWRDSDHFKNRGDYRRFAVFCLARIGTEIHDTALLCPVDRTLTDVTFPDVLVFNNVPAEFELTLEIYSHILQEDLSIASTPRRIKRSIHSSISRTVGKKLAASLRDELNSGKIGPHFELMASARLTLDDTEDNIHTHDLVLNNLENKNHSLPLFGHFCCRLAAQPECITKEACSGSIILDGRTCFARIQGFNLHSWDSRKLAEEEQTPLSTVPINRETLIQPSKSSSKELRISNTIDGSDKITTIRLDTAEEAQKWVRQLVAHAKDHLRWRHAAEIIQDVPSVESARNSFVSNKRQGSLYDETPLIESVQSDFNTASRPTVQEIFGLTPSTSLSSCNSSNSPPSLRSRSLSTSGTRKSGTNTLRSHWPFSNKNHD